MDGTMTLGGRTFRPILISNLSHDVWLIGQFRAAGLTQVTAGPGETPEEFANRLLGLVVQTGRIYAILGGLLVPAELEDLQWTPEIGEKTAAHIQTVTDPSEKAVVIGQIAALVASFFSDGLTSLKASPRSSGADGAGEARKSPTPAPSGMGSGLPSCGNSADTTSADTGRPEPGRSGRPWWRIGGIFGGKR